MSIEEDEGMNREGEWYSDILQYLKDGTYPKSTDKNDQLTIRRLSTNYIIRRERCWYRILFALNLRAGPRKIQKYYFLSMGPWEHLEWRGTAHSNTGAHRVHFLAKMTKTPLVNPRLTESKKKSKSPQNITFHSFTSNPSSSDIFSNFDQIWQSLTRSLLLVGPRNHNFDLAIRTNWNQRHWKNNQILIPTTIHRLKSELKRLRYWENCEKRISILPEVITFDPTVGILISLSFWKLDIKSFLGKSRSPQSESGKTSKYASDVKTEKVQ